MKYIILFLLSLVSIASTSQVITFDRLAAKDLFGLPVITDTVNRFRTGEVIYNPNTDRVYYSSNRSSGPKKVRLLTFEDLSSINSGLTIPGGPITSLPAIGFNPGTNLTATNWIKAVFYQSQAPLSSLTGGQDLEMRSAGAAIALNVNWVATRQAATASLTSIIITGASQTYPQTFSPPIPSASVNGTQSVNVPRNTSTTFINTVTSSDGKTSSSGTTFNFYWKRYWGLSSSNTPTNGAILALSQELASGKGKGTFSVANIGVPAYLVFCIPTSFGALTSLTIGGFESLDAFTRTTVSFTNALGATTNYYYYISNNSFTSDVNNIVTQ